MFHKLLLITIIAVTALSASAWDSMYVIGSGTPGGFDPGKAIAMARNGEYEWNAVCPLRNGEDNGVKKSFRLQETTNWDNKYYGPETSGFTLSMGEWANLKTNDNCFLVPEENVTYHIQAFSDNNVVKIFKLDQIYLVGAATPGGWSDKSGTAMKETSKGSNVWRTLCYLKKDADFRLQLYNVFDGGVYLTPDANKSTLESGKEQILYYHTTDGDKKFYVDQSGPYIVEADLNKSTIKVTRQENVYLMGEGTPAGYDMSKFVPMTMNGDGWYEAYCHINGKFRVQLNNEEWDSSYYSPATPGQSISDGQILDMAYGHDTYFNVASQGVYHVEANLSEKKIKITRMNDIYMVGPGIPQPGDDGWSTANAMPLNEVSAGVWETTCYLTGEFRVQLTKNYDNYYYGCQSWAQEIDAGGAADVAFRNENTLKVKVPGIYRVELNVNTNKISVTRHNTLWLQGVNGNWPDGLQRDYKLSNDNQADKSVYEGVVTFTNGSFKIATDLGHGYDSKYYLFRESQGKFNTSPDGDHQWTVGWPDQTSHVGSDIVPGTFRIVLNAATRSVNFYMLPKSVSLAGNGALTTWNTQSDGPRLEAGENGVYSAKHVFLTTEAFKPVVDGKYFGSHTWSNTTLTDGGVAYLRNVDSGGDFLASTPGMRSVTVRPSEAGDGTLSMEIGAPQSLWIEGLCELEYDKSTHSYLTKVDGTPVNSLHYISQENLKEYPFSVDGDVMAAPRADKPGWYSVSVTFNRYVPVYNFDYNTVRLQGDALCDEDANACKTLTLGEESLSGRIFVKSGVFLKEGGSISATLAGKESNSVMIDKSGSYSISVIPDEKNAPVLKITGPVMVNMPLKEADFANGEPHYFLVGQRMGAWRLQPEWEFVRQDDGSYEIPARLLYNGYVMVGMVDNYQDYIYQTYKGFTHTDTNSKSVLDPSQAKTDKTVDFPLTAISVVGNNGCDDGKFTGTRYNDYKRTATPFQHGGFEGAAYRLINIYDADGHGDIDHIKSMPSRVNSIRLTVDQWGNPSTLSFVGLNSDAEEVAKLRTFSLCGSRIRNLDIPYVAGVSTSPLNNRQENDGLPAYGGQEWAESWIQYEKKDVPYVDGYGEYIYQTSFTRNWLGAHPTYFKFVKDGSGDAEGLEYTSNNITFTYREGLTHDRQFGQRNFTDDYNLTHKEVLNTYSTLGSDGYETNLHASQNLDDKMIVNPDDMVCYVVDDMWMIGDFKVWAGWGGSITNFEYDDNGTFYTRWYGSNASHGAEGENRTAFYTPGEVQAYTLFRDVPAANFSVGYGDINTDKVDATGKIKDGAVPNRRFYKRVEIWYNLKTGFAYKGKDGNGLDQASFLVFYQEPRGPQISIDWANDNKNQINYTYGIQNASGTPIEMVDRTYGLITYYRIERYLLDEEGNMRSDEAVRAASSGNGTVVEERTLPEGQYLTSDAFAKTSVTDKEVLPAGRYRYKVTLKRTNTADHEFDALSNILAVTPSSTPSGVEAVNAASADGFAMTVVARDGMLHVNANAPIGKLAVYAVNGRLMSVSQVDGNAISIDISALPAGVYVANANNTSVRFIKR